MRSFVPVALTIAGSDSGGEAGIQADLKTFAALKVHGTSAITGITAQNRKVVARVQPSSPAMVRAQLEAVVSDYRIGAAKTGALFSAGIVREVARFFRRKCEVPLVVDPVFISTSGRGLLQRAGVELLRRELLPLAVLVTPNLAEAEVLIGRKIVTVEDLRGAAVKIQKLFGCAALVKGGHFRRSSEAVDFLCTHEGEWMLSVPRAKVRALHGTGCTYSAAIAAWLLRGKSLSKSVELAKEFITQAIHQNID